MQKTMVALLFLFSMPALAQTITMNDAYRECQKHSMRHTPAVVPAGQPGSFELGYEKCVAVTIAWRGSPEGQREISATAAISNRPDLIGKFVDDNIGK